MQPILREVAVLNEETVTSLSLPASHLSHPRHLQEVAETARGGLLEPPQRLSDAETKCSAVIFDFGGSRGLDRAIAANGRRSVRAESKVMRFIPETRFKLLYQPRPATPAHVEHTLCTGIDITVLRPA
jgi:hypothetical protein